MLLIAQKNPSTEETVNQIMVHNDKFNQLNINVLQMVRLKKHMKTKLVRAKLFNVLHYFFS